MKEMVEIVRDVTKLVMSRAGVVYLEGPPGSCKTAVCGQIAKNEGLAYTERLLSHEDSSEIAGIPDKVIVDGIMVMDKMVPRWAIEANKRPTLVNFDELNRGTLESRNAALKILRERIVGDYKLNDNVYFIATGNMGEKDGTDVEEMDSAMWGRLIPYPFNITYVDWREMYGAENVWDEVINYLDVSTEHFNKVFKESRKNASARSWTDFSDFVTRTSQEYDEMVSLSKKFAKNYLGVSIANAFNTYLEEKQLININSILDDWERVETVVKQFDRSRHSQLIAQLLKRNITSFTQKQITNLISFLHIINDDERANIIITYVNNPDYAILKERKYKDILKDVIRSQDSSIIWDKKYDISNGEKTLFHVIGEFWDNVSTFLGVSQKKENADEE